MEDKHFIHSIDVTTEDSLFVKTAFGYLDAHGFIDEMDRSNPSKIKCPGEPTLDVGTKQQKYQIWSNGECFGTFKVDDYGFMVASVPLRASNYISFDLLPEDSDKSEYDLLKRVGTACLESALTDVPLLNNLEIELHVTQLYEVKLEPVYYQLWHNEHFYGTGRISDGNKLILRNPVSHGRGQEIKFFYLIKSTGDGCESYDPTKIVGVATVEKSNSEVRFTSS